MRSNQGVCLAKLIMMFWRFQFQKIRQGYTCDEYHSNKSIYASHDYF